MKYAMKTLLISGVLAFSAAGYANEIDAKDPK